ncbi:MAG TPA: discoidin domain-containing protein, partial [Streptosporangiaceae bacterium]|nr:discoidin domain-containing protein [Streptosporangiaceae bacterium]
DTNSTDGAEPSHMRTPTDVNCDRGYEWWLMEQAKARNPGIKLYALEWGAPGWVGGGQRTVWTSQNITYLLSWLGCARSHGLTISYLGGWNESGYNQAWFEQLRSALDAHGYSGTQVVAADSFGWGVAGSMASDPAFSAAVNVVGVHYPCGYLGGYTDCPSTPAAQALGKPLWASEQGSQPYDSGAIPLARAINRQYTDGQMTATINWSLVWSAYDGLPFGGDGLMLANTPWSGHYVVGKSIWVMAHTAQFTQPGWRYLDSGSTRLAGGGSVVTLRSPSSGDWSSIAETTTADAPQQVSYQVSGGLSGGTVHVWATDLDSGDPAQWFSHVTDIQPQGGSFSLTLQPGYVYTLTTTTGQHKGTATAPASQPWALPYSENFDEYPAGTTPRYLSDLGGSFQTAPCLAGSGNQAAPPPGGMCLQQNVTAQPVQWNGWDNYPVTLTGDPNSWQNYRASVDALLTQPGYVELDGRALGPANAITGYHFRIGTSGQWSLYKQDVSGADTTLASGTATFSAGTWYRLGLELRGDTITAFLDHHALGSAVDGAYQMGQVGLQVSPWDTAQFDNLQVNQMPANGEQPGIGPITPDPAQIPQAGGSIPLSTTVTNPGPPAATAVSAQLQVPQGWTATAVTAPPSTLNGGQTAPVAWQLTAPASAAPGRYYATVAVTWRSGGQQWVSTSQVPVYLELIPQSLMTATATSYQPGYPPSNAIDGNPATLWHTEWSPVRAYPPQSITLDLGGVYNVRGLLYLPRQDGNPNGIITSYEVYVSADGTNFTQVSSGTWALSEAQKQASFSAGGVRYVRLVGVQAGNGYVSAAEINVIGTAQRSQE